MCVRHATHHAASPVRKQRLKRNHEERSPQPELPTSARMLASAFSTSAKIQSKERASWSTYWPKGRAHKEDALHLGPKLGERDEESTAAVAAAAGYGREGASVIPPPLPPQQRAQQHFNFKSQATRQANTPSTWSLLHPAGAGELNTSITITHRKVYPSLTGFVSNFSGAQTLLGAFLPGYSNVATQFYKLHRGLWVSGCSSTHCPFTSVPLPGYRQPGGGL